MTLKDPGGQISGGPWPKVDQSWEVAQDAGWPRVVSPGSTPWVDPPWIVGRPTVDPRWVSRCESGPLRAVHLSRHKWST